MLNCATAGETQYRMGFAWLWRVGDPIWRDHDSFPTSIVIYDLLHVA